MSLCLKIIVGISPYRITIHSYNAKDSVIIDKIFHLKIFTIEHYNWPYHFSKLDIANSPLHLVFYVYHILVERESQQTKSRVQETRV